MEHQKKGKQALMLWKSITEQSTRPCFPNTDYRTGTETDGEAVGTLTLWTSAGCLIWSILALLCWRFHLSEVKGNSEGNGCLAPSSGNKETLVDEKVVESLGEKNQTRKLSYSQCRKGGKHSLNTYWVLPTLHVTTFNSHNNPRKWDKSLLFTEKAIKKNRRWKRVKWLAQGYITHVCLPANLKFWPHTKLLSKKAGHCLTGHLDLKKKDVNQYSPDNATVTTHTHTPKSQNCDTMKVISSRLGSVLG